MRLGDSSPVMSPPGLAPTAGYAVATHWTDLGDGNTLVQYNDGTSQLFPTATIKMAASDPKIAPPLAMGAGASSPSPSTPASSSSSSWLLWIVAALVLFAVVSR